MWEEIFKNNGGFYTPNSRNPNKRKTRQLGTLPICYLSLIRSLRN
ncbi:BnaC09g46610D [Brassica napus]|uniref:BnaC09g46610D protein n=1 Tax=Brassica napus TaxID=3708 RepID=A0A078G8B8_BRANA|nr:BnaC09g46610D [Brassica napus]